MEFYSYLGERKIKINLSSPIDISIPITFSKKSLNGWQLPIPKKTPVQIDSWIGSVKHGAGVNINNIYFNPHAHTTHTECVGHISKTEKSINSQLRAFFFFSKLITVSPQNKNNDLIITKNIINSLVSETDNVEALIIRTLPNNKEKMHKDYSNTNPPYLSESAAEYLVSIGIQHLLIDLPSVDKENDGGLLSAHKSFWQFPKNIRYGCTITEFIYVASTIKDGKYLLNLQFAPFENDASPSRPLLFKLEKK